MVVLSVVLAVVLSIEVVKVSASVVRVVVSFTDIVVVSLTVAEIGTVVESGVEEVDASSSCVGGVRGRWFLGMVHTPYSPNRNTKTATVADSHRLSAYLGVGTTRFSLSGVIQ